jgi:hypothetical protein
MGGLGGPTPAGQMPRVWGPRGPGFRVSWGNREEVLLQAQQQAPPTMRLPLLG